MDISEYRKRYGRQLEQAAKKKRAFKELERMKSPKRRRALLAAADTESDLEAATRVMRDREADPDLRNTAIHLVGTSVRTHPELIDFLIQLVGDTKQSPGIRTAALTALQQSSFLAGRVAQKRPEYLTALRAVIDDKSAELRRRAIGILAREKDEYVQRRLLEGLENPSKALVPVAKAIQFLGYDVHAEHFPIIREIVRRPPTLTAKKEAVRLLASDTQSEALLAKLLQDPIENVEVRRISAAALQSLAPSRFERLAKQIALDDQEDDRIRATCISELMRDGFIGDSIR